MISETFPDLDTALFWKCPSDFSASGSQIGVESPPYVAPLTPRLTGRVASRVLAAVFGKKDPGS